MTKEAKILIFGLVAVVGILIGLFVFASRSSNPTAPIADGSKLIRDTSHKYGSGPISLVEFGDYECPACGAASAPVKQLLKDYKGKVTFYFRNFPLPQHRNALAAAEAAEAAGEQAKYWEMHDKLYEAQSDWSGLADPTEVFVGYAKTLGLDETTFRQSATSKKFQTIIDRDTADGTAL